MPSGIFAEPVRRLVTPLVTRLLRKHTEELQDKRHPERKKVLAGAKQAFKKAVAKRRYTKKQQFEKKFPTKSQRKVIKEKKKVFKQTKKIQKERYESDPIYRMGTVPRQQISDTQITWSLQNPLLPGFRRGLRKEAKHGSNIITRRTSSGVLKKISNFVENAQNLNKVFTSKGRKWLKKRKQEDATAKSILSGDV